MADQHHPVRHPHKKFNPTQTIEGLSVIIVGALGLLMLVGLLTASGRVTW
jgi:thiosulfate reductase cytochrome b subunit